jgi:hypothetical protein
MILNLGVNARQAKTLSAIFAHPTPSNIRWNEIVSLIEAVGDVDEKRAGSRVAFTVGGLTLITHKPHPGSEVGRAGIRDTRDFLKDAGITP